MGSYPPRGALDIYTNTSQPVIGWWGWGFYTVQGVVDPGELRFLPRVIGVVDGRISDPGMVNDAPQGSLALCTSPSQSTISQ